MSPFKMADIQPGYVVEVVYYLGKTELHVVKDVFVRERCNVSNDLSHLTVRSFILELFASVFTNPQSDPKSYFFLVNRMRSLQQSQGIALGLFPLKFLKDFTEYLGVVPSLPDREEDVFFKVSEGVFVSEEDNQTLSPAQSELFLAFLKGDNPPLNSENRAIILSVWLSYYTAHIANFRVPKSYEILADFL